MDSIITYLLLYNKYLLEGISKLLVFISKNIPLKQFAFEDSNSPKYQKFKVDKLPKIFNPDPVDYQLLLAYYKHKYNKVVTPVKRRSESAVVPEAILCPRCVAPHQYIYKNNGSKGQYQCKVCGELFSEANCLYAPSIFTLSLLWKYFGS